MTRVTFALLLILAIGLAIGMAVGMSFGEHSQQWRVDAANAERDTALDHASRALAVAGSCRDALGRSTGIAAQVVERQIDERQRCVEAFESCHCQQDKWVHAVAQVDAR